MLRSNVKAEAGAEVLG